MRWRTGNPPGLACIDPRDQNLNADAGAATIIAIPSDFARLPVTAEQFFEQIDTIHLHYVPMLSLLQACNTTC
jgi:hypothetical protein